ncbi:MAG TPA: hypothetical protein VGB91_03405, partial [Rhizomicrobium sp.]
DETAWVCLCGNTPDGDGFAACNADGLEIEPAVRSGWDGLYVCNRCGRIVDQKDLSVVAQK